MFYVISYTEFMISDLLSMTSYPLVRTTHHFMYDIKSTVSVLTSTASVSSHPTYRHNSNYMEGITCSISVPTKKGRVASRLTFSSVRSVLPSLGWLPEVSVIPRQVS